MVIKAIFFVLLLSCSLASAEPRIKIGVSTALSGDAATYGIDIKNALLFANQTLANSRYELIFQDDRCSGKDAASVAHQLLSISNLSYVLGYACSGAALAAAPILERAKVPTIIITASAAELSRAGEYIFRTFPSDQMAANKLIGYIASRHKRLGILTEETPYCQAMLDSSRLAPEASKLEIVAQNFLPGAAPDFRTPLIKLKSQGIDALFLNTQTEQSQVAAFKQIRELGLQYPIYSAYWAASPVFLKLIGTQGDGIIAVDLPSLEDTLNPEGKLLYDQFRRDYGDMKSIKTVFITAFEAFRALDLAIKSGSDVREYLKRSEFNGIFGKWHFDSNGEIVGLPFSIKQIKNGVPVVVER